MARWVVQSTLQLAEALHRRKRPVWGRWISSDSTRCCGPNLPLSTAGYLRGATRPTWQTVKTPPIFWRRLYRSCSGLSTTCEGIAAMADEQVKKKVYDVLKHGYFSDPDDAIDVSDGPEDSIHLVIFRACRRIQWEVTQASDPSLPLFFSPSFRFQFRPVFRFPTWSIPPSPASICSD